MSKLPDVRGRITYISSHAKQENLYAVYETTDRRYWTELAKCSQQEFEKSGTEGKCIEAREFIIALPESFPNLYEPDKLLQLFTDRFKEKYGVECVSALHHNKRKTNYHIHLIFSERELLPEPIEKTATRNMFYDEQGKHVRTKKEIFDENGNIRKGCKIVKKGEVYERNLFTAKNKLFKQEDFVDEVKHFYTDLINLLVKDDKEKLHVFDNSGLYLATKKIGKNNPKAEQIQTDNEMRMRWNCEVDRAIVSGVSEMGIQQIKKKYITDRIRESVDIFGSQPERLGSIIMTAVTALALLISKVLDKARELSAKFFEKESLQPVAEPNERKTTQVIPQTDKVQSQEKITHKEPTANPSAQKRELQPNTQAQTTEQKTPQTPPKPVMSAEAAAYPKLLKIYKELNRQNGIIFDAERERNGLELERDSLKGLAKLTKKGELQSRIDRKNEEIDLLKVGLSGIVKRYGLQTVHDFYKTFAASKTANAEYRDKVDKWEEQYGEKVQKKEESISKRLRNYQRENADRQTKQISKSRNRGAR
ncbi:MobA/MobL family protein [Mediterraneibacter agrestimuris]|uniref:MobA/MobL family protein n=1 Tax=Mediterraneibacter agrestimuris TaxID=2941333 RepID=UPI00203EFB2B|nr:MobA/MobL family protein [Mediterraneibacter agrestimuris]